MAEGPLSGVEVVELCSAISGPLACRLLGDHGARVTKIEPPAGESYRNLPPRYGADVPEDFTYRFLPYNAGKESIALDVKTDAGRDITAALIERADVLVENMRPGVLAKLGFTDEKLESINPELIACRITGYGRTGPYATWPAMDTAVQAVAGWADQIGAGEAPDTMNIFLLDHVTAVYTAFAVCLALIERGTTGEGRAIDISMLDVAVSFLNHHLAEQSAAASAGAEALYRGSNAPNDVIEVADGYVALYVGAASWERFCEAIERPEFAADGHRFATPAGRLEHRAELREALSAAMQARTKQEWTEYLNEHGDRGICAPVNRIADLFDDPQVRHRGSIRRREHPTLGPYTLPGPAFHRAGDDLDPGHAPRLGQHTDAILADLGYSASEIAALRRDDVIA